MSVLRRVSGVIRRYGEPYTVAGVARRGVFSTLATGQLARLFEGYVVDGFRRPMWSAVVAASDGTTPGATVQWRGGSYVVRTALDHLLKGAIVARELVLEPL